MDIILIGLGWLLAAGSAVLWLRRYPGWTSTLKQSDRGWQSTTLLAAAVGAGAYAGSGLQTRYHWGWWVVPAVYVPLFLIAAAPILTQRWQLRHSTRQPDRLDTSAGVPPAA